MSMKSIFSKGGRRNDTQAPLATALGDPNQTDHCSYKKKVNRVEM